MSTQIASTQEAFLELVADAKTRICEVTLEAPRAKAGAPESLLVVDRWRRLGYTNAASLIGGLGAWQAAGLPVSTDHPE